MKNKDNIEQEMIETKSQISKVRQTKQEKSIAWLYGFLTGLNWVLTGSKK